MSGVITWLQRVDYSMNTSVHQSAPPEKFTAALMLCWIKKSYHPNITAILPKLWWYELIFTKQQLCHLDLNQVRNKANLRDLIAVTGLVILLKLDWNHWLFSPCDLEIWQMTSRNNKVLLLYYVKLCASFRIHRWIQTGVTVWKCSIRFEIGDILSCVTLKFDGWPWKTIGHLFWAISSSVHNFHCHVWIQTGVTVRKRLNVVMTSVNLTFDIWPWHLAWTSLLSMVITPENFMMIWWQEHCEKCVTDRQTDRQTDRRTDEQTERSFLRAAWLQLKNYKCPHIDLSSW